MKKFSALILCLMMFFACMALPSCGAKSMFTYYSFDCFDTVTEIRGYETSKKDFDQTSKEIMSALQEYHRLFDIYNSYDGINNLRTVNSLKNGEHSAVEVDQRIIDLLLYSKEMHKKTDGKLNIAMGSVLSIWHDYRSAGKNNPAEATLPPTEQLQEAAKHTSINDIIIDEEHNTVFLQNPLMTLDVGAIAKGYAVEQIARTLEEKGIEGYMLNVGGNVRAVGKGYGGAKWSVGIENPIEDASKSHLATLQIEKMSVVTSGSYQRYYIVGDKKYHHIINPDTLMPSELYLSVSVICESSALADALSTALFSMSQEEGKALIDTLDKVEVMWVLKNGTIIRSDGFENIELD